MLTFSANLVSISAWSSLSGVTQDKKAYESQEITEKVSLRLLLAYQASVELEVEAVVAGRNRLLQSDDPELVGGKLERVQKVNLESIFVHGKIGRWFFSQHTWLETKFT